MKKTKKKNPSDLTRRNNDARKKEIAALTARVHNIEDILRVLKVALFQSL